MLNIYSQQNPDRGNESTNGAASKNPRVDFNKYEDPSGDFSSGDFKWSLWYVKHKLLLYKLAVGFLIGWIIIFGGYAAISLADYLIFGIASDINLYRQLGNFPDYTATHAKYAPVALRIESVEALPGGTTAYDLVARVGNPNKNFIVHFDYHFSIGEEKTPTQKGFLLAGEMKPVVYFGFKSGFPSGVNLVIENISWKRLRAQEIKDPAVFQAQRLNFLASDFSFTSQAASDGVGANIIKFDLKNDSAYGYRDANFVVGLMSGGTMAATMPLLLQDFKAGETRVVDLRNFVSNLPVDDIEIFPLIDTYNKEVYLAPSE